MATKTSGTRIGESANQQCEKPSSSARFAVFHESGSEISAIQ
jgi:hypothetical protein